MSFFHRRSRSASASRPQSPVSTSAQVAATQAFLASRASHANLSASAAAAALRSMTPTPTPVEHVQTKRTVQRQASAGALSGAGRGRSRGGLQRQSSAGSMSERTFRTPSPSPSRQPGRPQPADHPPLPNIPEQFASNTTGRGKKKVRASSQGPPPPRVLSPPLTRPSNRGQSLDRSRPLEQLSQAERTSNLAAVNEIERTDSYNSINFSRPLSPRPQSPAAQALPLTNGERAPGGLVTKAISPADAEDIQYKLLDTANQPVKKKKKKVVAGSNEGSHLHGGTMASKPVVANYEHDAEASQSQADQPRPVKKKKKKATTQGQTAYHAPSDTSSRTDSDSDSVSGAIDRRAHRASGMLTKQPSIVREDWEGEQTEEISPIEGHQAAEPASNSLQDGQTAPHSKRPTNTANVSRKIEEPTGPPKTVNQLVTSDSPSPSTQHEPQMVAATSATLQVVQQKPSRGTSLSPSRSTRFSDRLSSDLAAGQKHEPPPRSVSPAKPALKHHSPASGRYPNDPYARGSSVTPSEASDISSTSADGAPRRKKSVRVSFESQPEIVGTAAPAASTEGSSREKKGWLPQGRSKPPLNTIPSNDDMDELMKPRPQLPSFGSIRGQNFRGTDESIYAATPVSSPDGRAPAPTKENKPDTSTSSLATFAGANSNTYTTTGVSSDHAVGAILAQEPPRFSQQATKEHLSEPLPPEVTSVEGRVSLSDSETETSTDGETEEVEGPHQSDDKIRGMVHHVEQAPALGQQTRPGTGNSPRPEVPVLSLSPPTPAIEQAGPDDQWIVEVPGGFPVSHDTAGSLGNSAGLGIDSTSDDESDNDSIYSDAAEDPSELDGTGFGSIDAIVDSPIVPLSSTLPTIPESPLAQEQPQAQGPVRMASWEEAQARWTNIVEQTRQGPALSTPESKDSTLPPVKHVYDEVTLQQGREIPSEQQRQPQQQVAQPRRKKKTKVPVATGAPMPPTSAPVQAPTSAAARKKQQSVPQSGVGRPSSAASAAAAAAPFRQSMRASPPPAEPETGFRKSMRSTNQQAVPGPVRQQQRPAQVAASGSAQQPKAALQKKHIPPAPAAATPAAALAQRLPPMPLLVSNDSDSDSSFRKRRRRRATSESQHSMRRSMRSAPEPTLRGNGRSQIRSPSPEGGRPFSASGPRTTMRTSMRGSVDSGVPTLRGSPEAKRSSSLFGRRQKSPPPTPVFGLTQKHRSRIADSDDEDDVPRKNKYRSRFANDSDDEYDTTRLTPVRGIPRRDGDSDSTDLEDSSEDEKRPAQTPPRLQIPSSNGVAPVGEPLSPNTEKKRGLFGMFRGKKHKDDTSSLMGDTPQSPPRIDANKPAQLGFASAAERDRIIEQTRAKLEAAKEQEHPQSPQTSAKLQRRHQPQRMMSDSWPLPPNIQDSGRIRPSTSDGAPVKNGSTRLVDGSMRIKEPIQPVGRSGKKKKFPMLRKAFGLKD